MLTTGDVAQAVAALQEEGGRDLHVIDSIRLVQALLDHDLVDELHGRVAYQVSAARCSLMPRMLDRGSW